MESVENILLEKRVPGRFDGFERKLGPEMIKNAVARESVFTPLAAGGVEVPTARPPAKTSNMVL